MIWMCLMDCIRQCLREKKKNRHTTENCFCLLKITIPQLPRLTSRANLNFTLPLIGLRWLEKNNILDHPKGVGVADFDGARHIPGDVDHGNDWFDLLHPVPLVPLQGELILIRCNGTQRQQWGRSSSCELVSKSMSTLLSDELYMHDIN